MSDDLPEEWSHSKKSKYRLLKPAFKDFKGHDAILRVLWIRAQEAHRCESQLEPAKEHFRKVANESLREESLKMAREAERTAALSLFSAAPAPSGVRLN